MREIAELLPQIKFRFDVPYSELTTLGCGSKAPVAAYPDNDIELAQLLKTLFERKIPYFVISGGSNVIGCDAEYKGVVIVLKQGSFREISHIGDVICAGCGVKLIEVIQYGIAQGLGGMASLAGIPGGIGGAVRMNAGAREDDMANHVVEIFGCYRDGSVYHAVKEDIEWSYRHTSLPEDVIITGASMRLVPAVSEVEKKAVQQELELRRSHEPKGRTAGCMFKNISSEDSAGKLIDMVNLKGTLSGGARISEEHANFIVNFDNASEKDVLDLMKKARQSVAEMFNVYLVPEVIFMNPESEKELLAAPAPLKVAVLKGGNSSEREVSLRSGAAVAQALRNGNYDVAEIDLQKCEVTDEMRRADVVYVVLHGGFGEGGGIQELMEQENIAFVGSGSAACELVMDKIESKKLADSASIPTAKWCILTAENRKLPADFTFPLVLKAPNEGSTIGIELVKKAEDFEAALEREFKFAPEILAEEFVKGVEITVPVVNDTVLPAIEIASPSQFYDYDAKYLYKNGRTQYFCPVKSLSDEVVAKASDYALEFYKKAGCRDILRVDFIVTADGVPYFLEGNGIPGCTATSLVPKAAKVAGISFEQMTGTLVVKAFERSQEEKE
ncbi:MAG: UDP-N-acetylmuramate dehydrogenase [Lentisphaeria bacterium]|nr:UDP-N-acetylmuramate dehydrogenase [Lentisphaeria bacterium]